MDMLADWIGRIVAWVFRRPRLSVRVIDDDPDKTTGGLKFEAENTSPSPSSIHPIIHARFMYPSKGRLRRGTATFDVRELDRNLPPFQPKIFTASARQPPPRNGHAWFRVYRFRLRRGVPCRVRIRDALLEPLSPIGFWFELWRFRLLRRVRKSGSMTLSDYRALRRSQGPH